MRNLLILFFLLVGLCAAQTLDPQALLIEANAKIEDGFYEEGEEILEQITSNFPGELWDAEARMHKAFILFAVGRKVVDAEDVLRSIRSDFPGTEVSVRAGRELLSIQAAKGQFDSQSSEFADFLGELNQLIMETGGFTLGSEKFGIAQRLAGMTEEEQRDALYGLYSTASSKLDNASMIGRFTPQDFDADARRRAFLWKIKLLEFAPEALDYMTSWDLRSEAWRILGFQLPVARTDVYAPPEVYGQTPLPDSVVAESKPEVSFRITSGTIKEDPLSFENLSFSLDGVKIEKPSLRIDANLENITDDFLVYTLSTVPEESLQPGLHTVEVKASRLGNSERLESFSWNFTVDPNHNDSSSESLPSIHDTTLSLRHTHQNEGANSLLTLEKIQGKATRSAVAFDLANIDLSNLSKATLVLTIDEGEHVNGWGNGRTITAQALTAAWQEGNGKSFGLKKKDAVAGSGMGATWFSPLDEDISNDSANGNLSWNGGAANAPSAPAVIITNHQTGEVAFDVTSDLLNGAENGWLISKDEENAGSKISFYSKEGAAAAGDSELAPRLILEFGGSVASTTPSHSLLSKLGFSSGDIKLRPESSTSELRSMREHLQESPVAALVVEQALSQTTRSHPLITIASRTAYRSWLSDDFVRLA